MLLSLEHCSLFLTPSCLLAVICCAPCSLHPVVYRGGPDARKLIRQWEWEWPSSSVMDQLDAVRREEGITDVNAVHPSLLVRAGTAGGPTTRRQFKFNILITTFEFIVADANILSRVPFSALVVDEAQRLKNSSSMLLERLSLFHIPRKLLLTGTPIQKSGMH
jgi:hypothetical protein